MKLSGRNSVRSTDLCLRSWLEPRTMLFFLVITVDLTIAVIHFAQTGDISMFPPLLAYAAAYAGVKDLSTTMTSLLTKKPQETKPEQTSG